LLWLLLQIHPNPQFDAEAAAQELRDSMKGLGNKRHLFVIDGLIIISRYAAFSWHMHSDTKCRPRQRHFTAVSLLLPSFFSFLHVSHLPIHASPFPILDTAAML